MSNLQLRVYDRPKNGRHATFVLFLEEWRGWVELKCPKFTYKFRTLWC